MMVRLDVLLNDLMRKLGRRVRVARGFFGAELREMRRANGVGRPPRLYRDRQPNTIWPPQVVSWLGQGEQTNRMALSCKVYGAESPYPRLVWRWVSHGDPGPVTWGAVSAAALRKSRQRKGRA
jgi:hypothetical protein